VSFSAVPNRYVYVGVGLEGIVLTHFMHCIIVVVVVMVVMVVGAAAVY
jgi:hypothetical protein